jgi:NCS2 family nucleobase:cation symporter-2
MRKPAVGEVEFSGGLKCIDSIATTTNHNFQGARIMTESTQVHPVDERLPPGRLTLLGLQHVLVMYAGAVAVPLIVGGAMKMPKDQIAVLISADLFACGIATLVQAVGLWKFGIRLPVMMGVTFASVGPMLAMGLNPDLGLLGIYGAVIGAGVFGIVAAPLVSRMLPLFPPVVTGTIITVIGISLMRIGINWAAGSPYSNEPNYGDPLHLGVALLVLVVILLIVRFAQGFFANIAVLIGIVVGFGISLLFGKVNFAGLTRRGGWT